MNFRIEITIDGDPAPARVDQVTIKDCMQKLQPISFAVCDAIRSILLAMSVRNGVLQFDSATLRRDSFTYVITKL